MNTLKSIQQADRDMEPPIDSTSPRPVIPASIPPQQPHTQSMDRVPCESLLPIPCTTESTNNRTILSALGLRMLAVTPRLDPLVPMAEYIRLLHALASQVEAFRQPTPSLPAPVSSKWSSNNSQYFSYPDACLATSMVLALRFCRVVLLQLPAHPAFGRPLYRGIFHRLFQQADTFLLDIKEYLAMNGERNTTHAMIEHQDVGTKSTLVGIEKRLSTLLSCQASSSSIFSHPKGVNPMVEDVVSATLSAQQPSALQQGSKSWSGDTSSASSQMSVDSYGIEREHRSTRNVSSENDGMAGGTNLETILNHIQGHKVHTLPSLLACLSSPPSSQSLLSPPLQHPNDVSTAKPIMSHFGAAAVTEQDGTSSMSRANTSRTSSPIPNGAFLTSRLAQTSQVSSSTSSPPPEAEVTFANLADVATNPASRLGYIRRGPMQRAKSIRRELEKDPRMRSILPSTYSQARASSVAAKRAAGRGGRLIATSTSSSQARSTGAFTSCPPSSSSCSSSTALATTAGNHGQCLTDAEWKQQEQQHGNEKQDQKRHQDQAEQDSRVLDRMSQRIAEVEYFIVERIERELDRRALVRSQGAPVMCSRGGHLSSTTRSGHNLLYHLKSSTPHRLVAKWRDESPPQSPSPPAPPLPSFPDLPCSTCNSNQLPTLTVTTTTAASPSSSLSLTTAAATTAIAATTTTSRLAEASVKSSRGTKSQPRLSICTTTKSLTNSEILHDLENDVDALQNRLLSPKSSKYPTTPTTNPFSVPVSAIFQTRSTSPAPVESPQIPPPPQLPLPPTPPSLHPPSKEQRRAQQRLERVRNFERHYSTPTSLADIRDPIIVRQFTPLASSNVLQQPSQPPISDTAVDPNPSLTLDAVAVAGHDKGKNHKIESHIPDAIKHDPSVPLSAQEPHLTSPVRIPGPTYSSSPHYPVTASEVNTMAPNADTAPSYVELIRVPTSSSFADSVMLRRQAREHERKVEEERRLMKKQNEEQRRQAFLEEWRRSLAHQGSEEHGIVDATGKNAWARGLDGGDESKDEEGAPLQYLQVDPSVVDEEEEEDQEEHQAGKQQAEHSVMAASRSLPPPSSPSKPYTIQRPCTGQLSSIIPRSPSTATVSSLNSSTSTSWVNNGEPRAILQSPKSSRSNAIHTILQKHKAKTRIPTTAKATASGCSAANPIAKDKADNDDDDDEDGDTASIHSTTSSSREKAMNASSAFRYQYRRLSGVMPDATVRNGGSLPLVSGSLSSSSASIASTSSEGSRGSRSIETGTGAGTAFGSLTKHWPPPASSSSSSSNSSRSTITIKAGGTLERVTQPSSSPPPTSWRQATTTAIPQASNHPGASTPNPTAIIPSSSTSAMPATAHRNRRLPTVPDHTPAPSRSSLSGIPQRWPSPRKGTSSSASSTTSSGSYVRQAARHIRTPS